MKLQSMRQNFQPLPDDERHIFVRNYRDSRRLDFEILEASQVKKVKTKTAKGPTLPVLNAKQKAVAKQLGMTQKAMRELLAEQAAKNASLF